MYHLLEDEAFIYEHVACIICRKQLYDLGAIQVFAVGGCVGVSFPGQKRYEGVRFIVVSIMRG